MTAQATTAPVEIPDVGVYVANVNPGAQHMHFTRSMVDLVRGDMYQLWRGNLWAESGANISKARNELVRRFLNLPDGDWLLMIDSDMVYPPDVIPRLIGAAERTGAKAVGGLCVMLGELGPIPTLYQFDDVPGSSGITRVQFDYPDNALLQVAATGGACLMVHRDALLAYRQFQRDNQRWLLEHYAEPLVREMVKRDLIADPSEDFGWFSERVRTRRVKGADGLDRIAEHWMSEDLDFCLRLGMVGCDIYVDCTLQIGHAKHGRIWYARDIREGIGAPRAPVVAVIPMKDRLSLTRDLVHQLRMQRCHDEIIVCDNGSGRETKNWLSSQDDVTVIDCPDVGIHVMWNRAIDYALDKHGARVRVALLNNDLVLGPEFLRRLSRALDDHRDYAAVCGNYDGRRSSDAVIETHDISAGRMDGTGGFGGFAFMVRGEWFSSGYRFPEECVWWFGDNDLIAAIDYSSTGDSPKKCGIVTAAEVEHIDGGSQTAGDLAWSRFSEQTSRDRLAFAERWRKFRQADENRRRMRAGDLTPLYEHLCEQDTDVKAHLPRFYELVTKLDAKQVIELGVRTGVSSVAWLAALQQTDGHLWAVDINPAPPVVAGNSRCTTMQGDDLDPFVLAQLPDQVDIVFIDTIHTYGHTLAELEAYEPRVRPGGCIVLHDTAVETFDHHTADVAPDQPPFPVRHAIDDWLTKCPWGDPHVDWYDDSHGLAVIWVPEDAL